MENLSIEEIQAKIIAEKALHAELNAFSSDSMFAKWRKWTFVVSTVFGTVVSRFQTFLSDVKELLSKQKAGRARWYAEKAKQFQYGYSVVTDQDYYDNTGIDPDLIAASLVVKFAACVDVGKRLRLKLAGVINGPLVPLSSVQLAAFIDYMENDVKYAGVKIEYVNSIADALKLSYKIYYDPAVLDETGKRLDGTNDTPIQDTINDYLINGIRFNGLFVSSDLTDRLQAIPGVEIPSLQFAQARYGAEPFKTIVDFYNPDAGYLRIAPADLTLTFIPLAL